MTSYQEWIARRSKKPVYSAELPVARKSDGQETTLYIATHGGQWDGLHNFRPLLQAPSRIRHRAQGLTGQSSLTSYGDLTLALPRGRAVDSAGLITTDRLVADYTFEGRTAILRCGGPGLPYAQWWVVHKGRMGQPDWDNAKCTIPIKGLSADLADTLTPPNQYQAGGTMPEATVGQSIPLTLGTCLNITPRLIQENPWVYQFNDPAFGPVQGVDAVRVRGKVIASGYTLDLVQGTITFSGQPASTPTLDVRGRVSSIMGFASLLGDIVQDVLRTWDGADDADLDLPAFAAYNTAAPWKAGIYLDRKYSVKQVVDALLTGTLSIFHDTRAGLWTLRHLGDLSGTPDHVIEERDIKQGSYRHKPDGIGPAKQVTIMGRRNWTQGSDFDAGVSEADQAWLKERFQQRVVKDDSITALYPKARDLGPYETYLLETADMEALGARWLARFGAEHGEDELTTRLKGLPIELGDLVQVRRRRHGMEAGKLFRAWGGEEDHSKRLIKPQLWG